jgi:hypothetical protein
VNPSPEKEWQWEIETFPPSKGGHKRQLKEEGERIVKDTAAKVK